MVLVLFASLLLYACASTAACWWWRERASRLAEQMEEAVRHQAVFWHLCDEAEKAGRDPRLDRRVQSAYRLHMAFLFARRAS